MLGRFSPIFARYDEIAVEINGDGWNESPVYDTVDEIGKKFKLERWLKKKTPSLNRGFWPITTDVSRVFYTLEERIRMIEDPDYEENYLKTPDTRRDRSKITIT